MGAGAGGRTLGTAVAACKLEIVPLPAEGQKQHLELGTENGRQKKIHLMGPPLPSSATWKPPSLCSEENSKEGLARREGSVPVVAGSETMARCVRCPGVTTVNAAPPTSATYRGDVLECAYIYVHTRMCIYVHTCTCVYVHTCMCVCVHTHVCMCVHTQSLEIHIPKCRCLATSGIPGNLCLF